MNAKNKSPQDQNHIPGPAAAPRNLQADRPFWQARRDVPGAQSTRRPQLQVLIAPRRALRGVITAAAARLCLTGPVCVLDGGDLYAAPAVTRIARWLTRRPEEGLERIQVIQAFTCYQVEALLAQQQADSVPFLGLDLLNTFNDENAAPAHRDYLAQLVIQHLQRLAQQAVVLVGVAPAEDAPVNSYLAWLTRAADHVLNNDT